MVLLACTTLRRSIEVEWCANSYVKSQLERLAKQKHWSKLDIFSFWLIIFCVFYSRVIWCYLKIGTQKLQLWNKPCKLYYNKSFSTKSLEFAIHTFHSSVPDFTPSQIFPQIALAIGFLTSRWWVRVRRFCGFVAGGAVTQGVVGVSSGVCRGQGSQIQDRAVVTQGVVGGVIFWCV